MSQRTHRIVLFLCTGNYYRSRFAEILFNSLAGKMRLPWKASSRGLALERGVNNVGTMAPEAIQALEVLGIRAQDAVTRLPAQVTAEDLESADRVVALKHAEHLPLLQERFPAWAEKVEFWQVDDGSEALAMIEREVMDLTALLISGGKRQEAQEVTTEMVAPPVKQDVLKTSGAVIRLGRETKGRRGKGVTTISDVPLDDAGLLELAATLKKRCGTGGSVKDRTIEIQGDQRDRLTAVLKGMGYRVKRVGG